jgi:hypothetical protein
MNGGNSMMDVVLGFAVGVERQCAVDVVLDFDVGILFSEVLDHFLTILLGCRVRGGHAESDPQTCKARDQLANGLFFHAFLQKPVNKSERGTVCPARLLL